MKKNVKKLLLASMAFPIMVPISGFVSKSVNSKVSNNIVKTNSTLNSSTTVDSSSDGSINFNGNTYSSVEDAVNDFLAQDGTVTQKLYYGDVTEATSNNDYEIVNLNKLKEANSSSVKNAYKTLTDNYTSNLDQAKKSYLQNPVIKWMDSQGNRYDSETEARYAMENNGDYYTNPIAYYEVKDYSRLDKYGLPTVVKINPLNKQDLNELKQIAARNMLLNDTDTSFSIDRLSVDTYKNEKIYSSTGDFVGQNNDYIKNILNSVAYDLVTPIRENMPLNVKVEAIADRPVVLLQHYTNGGNWFDNRHIMEWVNITFDTKGYDSQASVFASDIRNETKYFQNDNSKYSDKFQFQYHAPYNTGSYTPIIDLVGKDNETVLGGQHLSFELSNADYMAKRYKYYYVPKFDSTGNSATQAKKIMLTKDDFGFFGRGSKSSGFFRFVVNQQNLNASVYSKNATLMSELKTRQQTVQNTVTESLSKTLNEWGFPDDEAQQTAKDIGKAAGEIIMDNILGTSDQYTTGTLWNGSEIDNTLKQLNYPIITKLDQKLKSEGKQTLTETLNKYLKLKYQARDVINSTSDIYVATYNGVPLFQIDQSLVSDLFNNDYFKTNPLDAVKKSLSNKLSKNYTSYLQTLTNGLTNISNSFKINNQKVQLSKSAIDNYNESEEYNFSFDSNTNNPNGFDSSVKLFDEKIFTDNNLTSTQLEKTLIRREGDSEAALNNAYGTFEAVYQYNKTLKEILNDKNASDTLKKNVKNNAIVDTNDVVVLYDSSNQPQTIKYGEYLNYGYKFNESLSDGNVKIISSIEKRKYEISAENLNIPTKEYTYYDYDGNVLLSGNVELTNGSYENGANIVYQNALNKIVVPASSNYVFYVNNDGTEELIKNKTTKLNVLTISDPTTKKVYRYGFTNYANLEKYVTDYVKGSVGIIDNDDNKPIFNRSATTAIVNGFLTSLSIIIIAEVVVMSYLFVRSNKNRSFNPSVVNKKYNF